MKLKDETISGFEVEVNITHYGQFQVDYNGTTIGHGDTLDQALNQARTRIAKMKVRVSVPFITHAGEKGVGTGVHASNHSVLVRIGANASQHDGSQVLRADTPQVIIDELTSNVNEIARLGRRNRSIKDEYNFRLKEEVNAAVEAARHEEVNK